jgi:tetratricopeptide (TPR) repeat protein
MPASRSEQVLDALKALLETVPGAFVERNSVLPEKIPDGGLIILRDGDPGEPEQALGGFGNAYYQHAVEIEVYVEEGDAPARDAAFDALLQQIGVALETNPTLGGFAFGLSYGRPEPAVEAIAGAPAIKSATLVVTVDYETDTLLAWPDRALAESDRALAEAAAGGHKVTLGLSQFYAAAVHELRREPERVAELAAHCVATCREQGVEFYLAVATILHGWALVQRGDAGAISSIREGLDAYLETGALLCVTYHRAKLADAYRAVGRPEQALSVLDEALAFAEEKDERFFEADLHRCRGEVTLLIDAGAAAAAEACFHRALDAARRAEARSLELRAARELARLWAQQGERQKAHDLLAPVYGWFTEGFDTPDIKDARALLEELR